MLKKINFSNFVHSTLFLTLITVSGMSKSHAQQTLSEYWKSEISNREIDVNKTSFCFVDRQGVLQGLNVAKTLPIASMSKVITSLSALRHYGSAQHIFKTTISYSASMNALHVESNGDPSLSDEKIWLIISKLNQWQVKKISKVTFNERFYFMPYVYRSPTFEYRWTEGTTTKIGPFSPFPAQTKSYLNLYLNTAKYTTLVKQQLTEISNQNKNVNKALAMSVTSVALSKTNPLLKATDLKQFSITSPALTKLLKYLNSVSNNPMADIIHYDIGGANTVMDAMRGILPADDLKNMTWYAGSGLPLTTIKTNSSTRQLNQLSCRGMLFVNDHFKNLVDALTLGDTFHIPQPFDAFSEGLLKTLPVSGREGTIRGYTALANVFVGKTGTLRDAKLLTTFISAKSGTRLLTMMGVAASEKLSRLSDVYRIMLNKSIEAFSGAAPFSYTPFSTSSNLTPNVKSAEELAATVALIPTTFKKIVFLINSSDCTESNCQELVQTILKSDRQWAQASTETDSLLQQAIIADNYFITRELLAAGANANHQVFKTKTPIFFLSVHQSLEMVKLLMEDANTQKDLRNNLNQSIAEYAKTYAFSDEIRDYLATFPK